MPSDERLEEIIGEHGTSCCCDGGTGRHDADCTMVHILNAARTIAHEAYRAGMEEAAKVCLGERATRCRWIEERPNGKHVKEWMAERDVLQAIASALHSIARSGQKG